MASAMNPASDHHEQRLIARVGAGDEEAFATLCRRFGPEMQRVAVRLVGSEAVAQEVVQEAWLRVIASARRFERRSSVRTWLLTILVNCARRGRDRERRSVSFSDLPGEPGDWERMGVPLWQVAPEDETAGREVIGCVWQAIAALPPTQRAVLIMRDIEGRPAEEVCRSLGVTAGHQRVLLHRARTRVRSEVLDGRRYGLLA